MCVVRSNEPCHVTCPSLSRDVGGSHQVLPPQCPPTSAPAQLTPTNVDAIVTYKHPINTHQHRHVTPLPSTNFQLTPTNADAVAPTNTLLTCTNVDAITAYKSLVDAHQPRRHRRLQMPRRCTCQPTTPPPSRPPMCPSPDPRDVGRS